MSQEESTTSPLYLFICSEDFGPEVKKSARDAYDLARRQGHNPGAFFAATQEACLVQAICKRCFGEILIDENLVIGVPRLCRTDRSF